MKILRIKSAPSTNDYVLRFVKSGEDTVVVSNLQTSGRGTKGRSFSSPEGGIYLSRLKFYDDLYARDAFSIIRDASVAVVKTLLAFNVKAKIKWPNDILVDGKKICGMLTENKLDGEKVTYSVIGIGLNVNNEIPPELKDIAVSMRELVGEQNLESVLMTLLFNLSVKSEIGQYVGYSCVLGKEVTVTENEKTYTAVVKEILDDGRIEFDDGRTVSSAEIKLRIK